MGRWAAQIRSAGVERADNFEKPVHDAYLLLVLPLPGLRRVDDMYRL